MNENLLQMVGKTMESVTVSHRNEALTFVATDGTIFRLHHKRDCCENVAIEDMCGDLDDLVGSPITQAEEVVSDQEGGQPSQAVSWTWTYYKFATVKGSVTVRWLGISNGNYSEGVSLDIIEQAEATIQ